MKVEGNNGTTTTLMSPSAFRGSYMAKKALQKYTVELVRQLEIVTIRNPQLAQHVNFWRG